MGCAALLAVAAAIAVVGWRVSEHIPPPSTGAPVPGARFEEDAPEPVPDNAGRAATATITIVRARPEQGTVNVQLALSVPPRFYAQLRDTKTGKPIVSGSTDYVELERRYRTMRWRVVVINAVAVAQERTSGSTLRSEAEVIDSGWDPNGSEGPELSLNPSTFVLTSFGSSDQYPFDWLATVTDVLVVVPDGLRLGREGATVPVRKEFRTTGALAGFRVTHDGSDASDEPVALVVERRVAARAFVLVILVAPLALAIAIGVAVLSSGHVRSVEARDLLIGMTAASVAVVPLRAVLVPSDLPGPTLVDWLLGAELLVFVAVGLLALVRAR